MSVEINNRDELYNLFQQRLEGTHESLVEDSRLDHDQKMVKTYIIESNIGAEEFISQTDIIANSHQLEPNLYELEVVHNGDQGEFYLDSRDGRFWSLYTLTGSQFSSQIFGKLTSKDGNGLDHPWIPNDTQRQIIKLGEFKGAGLKQQAKKAFSPEYTGKQLDVSDFRLELDGDDTQHFYSLFKQHTEIEKILSLSRIKIRHNADEDFITERITHEGAFTARGGTDIELHLKIVDEVKERYSRLIELIESNHRISYEGLEYGSRVKGKHLTIELENEITDIEQFVSEIVDASDPFRLMGTTTKLKDGYYKMKGIDMHNGDKVSLEIAPEWIRVYLFDDACGNTALRIFTNIQQYYDPAASMEIENV